MKIFTSKYFTNFMYLAIILVLLLIFVNFIDVVNKLNESNFTISGNAPKVDESINITSEDNEKLYSMQSYTIFYVTLIFIILAITIISFQIVFPRIKKYT